MSWVQEEWKDGLSQKALIKITEIENQNEKLIKEAKQKQFQLESLEAAYGKQKKRVEDERSEIVALKRENQSLNEICAKLEQKNEKLQHDFRNKESYLNSIEGQLQRAKAQLETYTSKTPKHHRSMINEEELDKLRTRLSEVESHFAREKDISSKLEKELSDLKNKPSKPSSYISSLPWATDDYTSPVKPQKSVVRDLLTGSPMNGGGDSPMSLLPAPSRSSANNIELKQLKNELEGAVRERMKMKEEFDAEMKEMKTKLFEKDKLIGKQQDELMKPNPGREKGDTKRSRRASELFTSCVSYASQVEEYERKLKQITEELKSEKEDAEVVKTNLLNKLQNEEKARRQDSSRAQESMRSMERQMNEIKARMSQEISRLKNELQQIQSELDKTGLGFSKQAEELKQTHQKVSQLGQIHQNDEKKMNEATMKLKALNQEKEILCTKLDRCENKVRSLERDQESLKRDFHSCQGQLTDARREFDEKERELGSLKEKSDKLGKTQSINIDNLKLKISDLENKKSRVDDVIKQKDKELLELSSSLASLECNSNEAAIKLEKYSKECSALTKENSMLIEQSEMTVTQLKKTKGEFEEFKEKHDAEIMKMTQAFDDELLSWKKRMDSNKVAAEEEVNALMRKHKSEVEELVSKLQKKDEMLDGAMLECKKKSEQLGEVKDELKKLKICIAAAEEAKTNLVTQSDSLKQEIEETKSKLCDAELKLSDVEKTHCSLSEHHSVLMEKHKILTEEARADLIEKKSLEGRVQDLEEQVKCLKNDEEESLSLRSRLKESEDREQESSKKLAHLNQRCEDYNEKLKDIEDENKNMRANMEMIEQDKEDIAEELNKVSLSLEERISTYESSINSQRNEICNLHQSNQTLVDEKEDLVKELLESKSVADKLRSACSELTQHSTALARSLDIKDDEITTLHSDLSKHFEEFAKLQKECEESQTECIRVTKNLSDLQEEQECFNNLHLSVVEELKQMKNEQCLLNDNIESLVATKTELQQEVEETRNAMKLKIAQCEDLLQERNNEIFRLEEVAATLSQENMNKCGVIEDLTKKSNAHEVEISNFEAKVKNLEDLLQAEKTRSCSLIQKHDVAIECVHEESARLTSEVESLKLQLEEVTSEKIAIDDVAESRLKVIENNEEDMKRLQEELKKIQNTHHDVTTKLEEAKDTMEEDQRKLDLMTQKVEERDAELSRMSKLLETSLCDVTALQEQLVNNDLKLDAARKKFEEAESKSHGLEEQVDEQSGEIFELKSRHEQEEASMSRRISQLQDDNKLLQNQLAGSSTQVQLMDDALQSVKSENKDLLQKLEDSCTEQQKLLSNHELMQMDMEDKDEVIRKFECEALPNLNHQLMQAKENLNECKSEIAILENNVASLSDASQILKEEKEGLLEQMDSVRLDLGSQKQTSLILQSNIDGLVGEKQLLQEELSRLKLRLQNEEKIQDEIDDTISSLTSKLEEKEFVIAQLTAKIECLTKEHQNLQEELHHSFSGGKEVLESLEEKLSQLQEAESLNNTLRSTLLEERKSTIDETVALEKQLKSSKKECETLRCEVNRLTSEIVEIKSSSENFEVLYDRISQDNTQLRAEVENLSDELATASHTLMKLESQLGDAERLSESTQLAHADVTAKMQSSIDNLKDEKKSAEDEVCRLLVEIESLISTKESADNEAHEMKTLYERVNATNLELQIQLRDNKKVGECMSQTACDLEEQIVELKSSLCMSDDKLNQANADHASLQLTLSNKLHDTEMKMVTMKDDVIELQELLSKEQQHKFALTDELDTLRGKERALLQHKEENESFITTLREKLDAAEGKLCELLKENEECLESIKKHEAMLHELKETSDDTIKSLVEKRDGIEMELLKKSNELDGQLKDLEEKNNHVGLLQKEVERLSSQFQQTTESLQLKNDEILQKNHQIEEINAINKSLKINEEQLLRKMNERLEEHNKEMKIKDEQQSAIVEHLKTTISELTAEKNNVMGILEETKKEAIEVFEERSKFEAMVSEMQEKISEMEIMQEKLVAELESSNSKIIKYEAHVRILNGEKDEVTKENDQLNVALANAETKHTFLVNSLHEEINNIRCDVERMSSELSSTQMELHAKENDVVVLQQKNEVLAQNAAVQATHLEKSKTELSVLLEELTALRESCSNSSSELEESRQKIKKLHLSKEHLQNELDGKVARLSDEVLSSNKELEDTKKNLQNISDQLSQTFASLQTKETEVMKLRDELKKMEETLHADALQWKYTKEQLSDSIALLSHQIDHLSAELEVKSSSNIMLMNSKAEQMEALDRITAQLEDEKSQRRDNEIEHQKEMQLIAEECDKMKVHMSQLKKIIKDHESRHDADDAAIEAEKTKVSCLETKINEIMSLMSKLNEEKEEFQCKAESLSLELRIHSHDLSIEKEKYQQLSSDKQLRNDELMQLQSQLTEVNVKNENFQQQISETTEEYKALELRHCKLESESRDLFFTISQLEDKLDLERQGREFDLLTHKKELSFQEKEQEDARMRYCNEIKCKKKEIRKLKDSLEQFRRHNEELNEENKDKSFECETLKERLTHYDEEAEKMKTKYQDLLEKISPLQAYVSMKEDELTAALRDLSEKTMEIKDLQCRVCQFEKELSSSFSSNNETVARLEEKLNSASCDNQQLRCSWKEALEDAQSYRDAVAEFESNCTKMSDQVSELKTQLRDAEDVARSFEEEKSDLSKKLKESEVTIQELCDRINAAEDELSEKQREQLVEVDGYKLELSEKSKELHLQTTQIEEFKDELIRSSDVVKDLITKLNDAEERLKDAASLINELQDSQRNYIDSASLAEKELQQLRHEHDLGMEEKKVQIEKLESSEMVAKLENDRLQDSLNDLRSSLQDAESQLQDVRSDLEDVEASKESVVLTLNERDEEVARLKEDVDKLTCQRSTSDEIIVRLEDAVAEFESNCTKMSDQVSELKTQLRDAENVARSFEEEKSDLSKKLKESEVTIQELCDRINAAEDELSEKQREQLVEMDGYKLELSEKSKELHLQTTQIEEFKDELIRSSDVVKDLVSKLNDAEERLKDAASLINELQDSQRNYIDSASLAEKELQQLRHEHDLGMEEKKVQIEELESSEMVAKLENDRLQDSLNDLRSSLQDAESQLQDVRSDLEDVEASKESVVLTLNERDEEVARLKEDVDKLTLQMSSLSSVLSENDATNKNLELMIESITRSKKKELENMSLEIQEAKEAKSDLETENKILINQLGVKDKQVNDLREQLSVMESVISETSFTNSQMTDQLKILNDAINRDASAYKKKIEDLREDNDKLMDGFAAVKQAAQELRKNTDKLEAEKIESHSRISLLQSQQDSLLHEKHLLEEEKDVLRDELSSLSNELRSTKLSLEDAEVSMQEMESRITEQEERVRESENLLEETSLAMEALRVSLSDEREKVLEQQQLYACANNKSHDSIASLNREVEELREKMIEMEEDNRSKTDEICRKYELREEEIKSHSSKVLDEFEELNKEVQDIERRNVSLESEASDLKKKLCEVEERYKSEKESASLAASSKLQTLIKEVEMLRLQIDDSEAEKFRLKNEAVKLVEDVKSQKEQLKRLKEVDDENARLLRDLETLRGKLKLMTTTAKRKEQELHRAMQAKAGCDTTPAIGQFKQPIRDEKSRESDTSSHESSSQPFTLQRSRPKRSSRKSAKMEKMVSPKSRSSSLVHSRTQVDKTPKKSRLSDETSSSTSPVYQVEGLPHLVNKGFTNIPLGFSSPFVVRRQQLSQTKQLVAAAMAKQKSSLSTDINSNITEDPPLQSTQEIASDDVNRKSLKKHHNQMGKLPSDLSNGGDNEPLKTVTNSPKRFTSQPSSGSKSGGRKLRIGLTTPQDQKSSGSKEEEFDCKVQ